MVNLKDLLPDGAELGKVFTGHGKAFKVNEDIEMINLKDILREGIEWQGILVKDAIVRYNNKPTGGGAPRSLQFVGSSYAKVPKGTFLIGLPGGLFAVNLKEKFAMALTGGRRYWLDAQDKLKDGDVGGTNMAPDYSKWRHLLDH